MGAGFEVSAWQQKQLQVREQQAAYGSNSMPDRHWRLHGSPNNLGMQRPQQAVSR